MAAFFIDLNIYIDEFECIQKFLSMFELNLMPIVNVLYLMLEMG